MIDALRTMSRQGAELAEVRAEAVETYNRRLDERMQGTVWTTGCSSWHLDDTGRNATLWPDWTFRFRKRASHFDPSEYELTAPAWERERVAARPG